MKYAVDEIIDDICRLENITTGEILEISMQKLPSEAHEGSIILDNDGAYVLDKEEEKERRNSFRARLDKLKKKD